MTEECDVESDANHDMFVMVILSYCSKKDKKVIYGTDLLPVDVESSIEASFNGRDAPNLKMKPKIFITQTVRYSKEAGQYMYSLLFINSF